MKQYYCSIKRLLVTILLFLLFSSNIFSIPLSDVLDNDTVAALVSEESIASVQDGNFAPVLLPESNYIHSIVSDMVETVRPALLIETLCLYRKPASSRHPWTETEQTGLYNKTLALSALAGIQYFSTSRGKMRTFYESSSIVSGPDGKTQLPDPFFANPLSHYTLYALQRDLTFGNNIYKYDYYLQDDLLLFVQENLTTMYYGIIPLVRKHNLRSMIAIIDTDESLLVYSVSMIKAVNVPGAKDRIGRSFLARIDALYGWFSEKADEVFLRQ